MNNNYKIIKVRDIQNCDVVFTDFDEQNLPLFPLVAVRKLPQGFFALNIKTTEMSVIEMDADEDIYFVENIECIIKTFMSKHKIYKWLGFEHKKFKVLVDLDERSAELYNRETDEWDSIDVDSNESSITIKLDEKLIFIIDLNNHTMSMIDKHKIRYNPFYNYLLGEEDDFVFDENNNLVFNGGNNNE